ncbi:MAG TPA: nuclease, partial [Acidobacteriaceae bacterium]
MATPGWAWSNRGHRLVNHAAAASLPQEMPAFMRSPEAVAEISYLGPEPDRWRPNTEPELSHISSPDHVFRVELGELVSPLPRRRLEFAAHLEQLRAQDGPQANVMRPELIGTLPWQAEEIFERLTSAFRSYRIASGDMKDADWLDESPITAADIPYAE